MIVELKGHSGNFAISSSFYKDSSALRIGIMLVSCPEKKFIFFLFLSSTNKLIIRLKGIVHPILTNYKLPYFTLYN